MPRSASASRKDGAKMTTRCPKTAKTSRASASPASTPRLRSGVATRPGMRLDSSRAKPRVSSRVTSPGTPLASLTLPALSLANPHLLGAIFTRTHLVEFLIAAVAIGLYCLLCLGSPIMRCDCEPGKKRAKCRKCKGHGKRYRPGAVFVCNTYMIFRGERQQEKLRDRLADLLNRYQDGDQS